MFSKNKLILYLAFLCYAIAFYICSWLPERTSLINYVYYIVESLTIMVFLICFDFSILKTRIDLVHKENKYITLLIILLLISSAVYNYREFRNIFYISNYFSYIFYFFIYFFWLPKFIIENIVYLRKIISFISIFSLVFSSIGLILSFANITPEVRFEGKVTSVFIHPNYVPSVCLAGIFSTLALYHTVDKERIDKKLFFIISFIVQFAALAFSYTRDGMIAFLLGVTIFYFLSYRRKFIIALPFLIMLIPPALIAFIKLKGFVSFLSRFWLLIPAYYMFISDKTRMIWGYGAHNATMVYVQFKTMYNVMEDVNSPHNSYISYILMYGLLFVLLFIFLILKTIIKGFKKALKEKNHLPRVYWSLFISVVVAYLTVNLFESHLAMTFTTMMQPFLIFLGLLFFAIKNDDFSRGIKELTEKN